MIETGKKLKDMTIWELREECRPLFEREKREQRERIDEFLQLLNPVGYKRKE